MPVTTAVVSGGSGIYLNDASVTGAFNLRASHTLMIRVKWTSTLTTERYEPIVYFQPSGSFSSSSIGRAASDAFAGATGTRAGRSNTSGTFTSNQVQGPTTFGNTTTWYHLAMVYDASAQTITYYKDGVSTGSISSLTTQTANTAACTLAVGIAKAKQADAAVFNRALSAGEVASMADYRVPQVTSGLIAFYRFDANANDSSGNSNNLTNAGSGTAPTYSTADPPPQPEIPLTLVDSTAASSSGLVGALNTTKPVASTAASSTGLVAALGTTKPIASVAASSSGLVAKASGLVGSTAASSTSFSATLTPPFIPLASAAATSSDLVGWLRPRWGRRVATSASLSRGPSFSIPQSAWTFAGWFKQIVSGTSRFQLSGNSRIVHLGTNGIGQRFLNFFNGTTDDIAYTATDDGNWHHLAMTYDGTTGRAYVDGVQVASAALSVGTNFTNLLIAGGVSGVGEVAHVKAWTTALSAAQLASEATYYTPHQALPNLYAWWQLAWNNVTADSGPIGWTLTDSSSQEARFESPGEPLQLIASTAATSSGLLGALGTTKPVLGTADTASTFTAKVSVLVRGVGSSESTFTGTVTVELPFASTAASSSAFVAAMQSLIDGSASTSSALAGALTQAYGIGSTLQTNSAFTGLMGLLGAFGSVAQTASSFTAGLTTEKPIAGTLDTSSAFTAAMVQNFAIRGTLQTASAFSGTLNLPVAIQGTLSSASQMSGAVTPLVLLTGTLDSGTSFTAKVTGLARGTAVTSSALVADISVVFENRLVARATTGSTFLGALTVTVPVSARGNVVTAGSAKPEFGPDFIASPWNRGRAWPPKY